MLGDKLTEPLAMPQTQRWLIFGISQTAHESLCCAAVHVPDALWHIKSQTVVLTVTCLLAILSFHHHLISISTHQPWKKSVEPSGSLDMCYSTNLVKRNSPFSHWSLATATLHLANGRSALLPKYPHILQSWIASKHASYSSTPLCCKLKPSFASSLLLTRSIHLTNK